MTGTIRCVIVDDEALGREAVRSLVALDPALEVVGEARDGGEAASVVAGCRPDLLFLDVQMPEIDGFEVLQALQAARIRVPVTVFVTAYDLYALRAFEMHALDYLLKPVREERFRAAMAAAKSRIAAEEGWYSADELVTLLAQNNLLARPPARLPVKAGDRIVFVSLDRVEWIEAEGNYSRLHLVDASYALRGSISALEARLDPARFVRVHRSAIVNVDRIKYMAPWFTGEYVIGMESGKELTLTRKYRYSLHRLLGKNQV